MCDRRIPDSFSGKTTWSAPTRFRIFSIISSFAFAITFGTPSSFADITHMMLESKLSAIATTTASMFEIPVSLSASISQTSRLMAQVTLSAISFTISGFPSIASTSAPFLYNSVAMLFPYRPRPITAIDLFIYFIPPTLQ